jgi:hypothetical protein
MTERVLYVIACRAPLAREVDKRVRLAQDKSWDVCVLATPSGSRFLDTGQLEQLTRHPVRSDYKEPGTPDVLPSPDAIGKKLPLVALPFTNKAHAARPAFAENVERLRSWGVTILFGPEVYPLHEPGTGSNFLHLYPWHMTLDALEGIGPRRTA